MLIRIYSKPDCSHCQAAKEYFQARGLAYKEFDVTGDARARVEWLELSRRQVVPVIVIDRKVFVGFEANKPWIEQMLSPEEAK